MTILHSYQENYTLHADDNFVFAPDQVARTLVLGAPNTRITRAGNVRITRAGNARITRNAQIITFYPVVLRAETENYMLHAED